MTYGVPMGAYNNFGTGGAGSHNFGRKKREAEPQYNNFGTGGAGSFNYGVPMTMPMAVPTVPMTYGVPMGTYNNWGTGGAGSHNFGRKKREAEPQYNNFGTGGAGSFNYGVPM